MYARVYWLSRQSAIVVARNVPSTTMPSGVAWVGLVLLLWGGVALRLWSFRTLGRYFTFTVQTSADQPVITDGPYRVVRHPSYAGILLAVMGIGLFIESAFLRRPDRLRDVRCRVPHQGGGARAPAGVRALPRSTPPPTSGWCPSYGDDRSPSCRGRRAVTGRGRRERAAQPRGRRPARRCSTTDASRWGLFSDTRKCDQRYEPWKVPGNWCSSTETPACNRRRA